MPCILMFEYIPLFVYGLKIYFDLLYYKFWAVDIGNGIIQPKKDATLPFLSVLIDICLNALELYKH